MGPFLGISCGISREIRPGNRPWNMPGILTRVGGSGAILALLLCSLANAKTPPTTSYDVAGLSKPATIHIDTWGVPHIRAQTHYDAFFVQGFNAARDRLWQIDTWRRRGLGRLSEVFGADYVEQDRAARLFLYRGDMYREWLAYGSDAKVITEAFVAGINAYIDLIGAHPDLLPPEFELLNYRPARWHAEDVVRIRSNGLWRNVVNEVRRARIICKAGLAAAAQWQPLEPAWTLKVPEGFDPCMLPEGVLDVYRLAKAPVTFTSQDRPAIALQDTDAAADLGSNNWVVHGSRTSTGRPILADDPHRTHAVPSLRYVAHLKAPGLNVIGAGEPALPGISIGHNERIGFGLTIFPIDQEDLYVYRKRGRGYRYQGTNEPVVEVADVIKVAGGEPRVVTLRFTRHGPIVHETRTHLFAVRAAWLTEGMSPYFGSIEYMRAQNWRQFLAALNRWGAPSENQVYADIDGNIGYKPAGLFPKRVGYDGLLPVPGDGRYEWDGHFDMDVLPVEYNPERGYTGTANNMNLPPDYPIARYPIGFEWSQPWRYTRLFEVLAEQPRHTLQDSTALQRDYHSVFARRILAHLRKLERASITPDAKPAYDLLTAWNGEMRADSAAAALFVVWHERHLNTALERRLVPSDPALVDGMSTQGVIAALEDGDPEAVPTTALLTETLSAAWAETLALFGPQPKNWRWGTLHTTQFKHPLLDMAPAPLNAQMRMPPMSRGGTSNTTNNTGFDANFRLRSGATFRMVLDVGNWDAATMTNSPGQSGDPRSPHYQDLLEGWAQEASFPLLYSDEAVDAATNRIIRLQPAG